MTAFRFWDAAIRLRRWRFWHHKWTELLHQYRALNSFVEKILETIVLLFIIRQHTAHVTFAIVKFLVFLIENDWHRSQELKSRSLHIVSDMTYSFKVIESNSCKFTIPITVPTTESDTQLTPLGIRLKINPQKLKHFNFYVKVKKYF